MTRRRSRRELEQAIADLDPSVDDEPTSLAQAIADLAAERREALADAFAARGVDDAEAAAAEHLPKLRRGMAYGDLDDDVSVAEYVEGVLDGGDADA